MTYTLFISAQQVIDLSLSERPNFKADKIRDAIILAAQEEWIRPVLGDAFYHHLRQELLTELSENNTILIENFLRPCLAFYVKYLALPDLENPLTNKGSQELFGQQSKAVSKEDKAVKRGVAKQTADTLAGVLKRFIESNKTVFTLYQEENNVKNRVSIRGGVILRKRKRKPPFTTQTIAIENMKTYDYQANEEGYFEIDFSDIKATGEQVDIVVKNSIGQLVDEFDIDVNYDTANQTLEAWILTDKQRDYSGTITVTVNN